jgi:hypothetical protein
LRCTSRQIWPVPWFPPSVPPLADRPHLGSPF